jgi:hypothetical protein
MKTLSLRHLFIIVLAAMFVSLGSIPSQAGITTTLFSEDFSSYSFPPNGWYDYSYSWWYDGPGWYYSSNGDGGSNGSAVCDLFNYTAGPIQSPVIDASSFTASGDNVYLEFDYWFEMDAYNYYYGDDYVYVNLNTSNGSTQLLALATSSDYTFDNSGSFGYYIDPDPSPKYWKHVKLAIPSQYRTSDMTFQIDGEYNAAGGNFAFDNFTVTGEQPLNISYNPQLLDFGTLSGGVVSAPQCVTLTNESPIAVPIGLVTITGSTTQYQLVQPVPTEIPADGSVDVCVQFAPTLNGPQNATLHISNASDNNPNISVILVGEAVSPTIAIEPIGPINTPTKMFRKTRTMLRDSLSQSFLIRNTGAGLLEFDPATYFNGDAAQMYSITHVPKYALGPGLADTVTVTFGPTTEGIQTARLHVLSNASNGEQDIDLSGAGVLPRISLMPAGMMTIDSVPMGTTVCRTITITNNGSDTLVITHNYLSSADGDFSYDALTNDSVIRVPGAGGFITKQICFTPLQKGTRRARLRVTTNIPMTFETRTVQVPDGEGGYNTVTVDAPRDTSFAELEIWANAIPSDRSKIVPGTFADAVIGTSETSSLVFTNQGSEVLTLSAPYFSGTNTSAFKVTKANFPLDVQPGQSISFDMVASPALRGANTATIHVPVLSDDGNSFELAADLAVNGLAVCADPSAQSIAFDEVTTGDAESRTIEITNCGDIASTYTAHTNGNGFAIDGEAVQTVAPGDKAEFAVKFAPKTAGSFTGSLSVASQYISDISVALSGDAKTSVESVNTSYTQNGYSLGENYPNPLSSKTSFSFTLPERASVKVSLLDVTGKLVKEIANGTFESGTHSVTVTAGDIASGTYVYLLEAQGVRLARQMVVSK